jgi:hypothetical protein
VPADGETSSLLQFDEVDSRAYRDPLAKNLSLFAYPAPSTSRSRNGSPRSSPTLLDVSKHPLYFGKAVVLVRRHAGQSGKNVLTASADGLAPATRRLK